MGIIGFRCVRGDISMEEHRQCMRGEAPCGFPVTFLEKMVRAREDREGVVFSPSSIFGCQRQHALQEGHDWYLNPDVAYYQIRGTLLHEGIAQEPAPTTELGVLRELRLFAPLETAFGVQQFSGQLDEILLHKIEGDVLHVSITDWKTKGDIAHKFTEPEERHVQQINAYNWLVSRALPEHLRKVGSYPVKGVVVDSVNIVYISMSRVRSFTSRGISYTRGRILGERGSDGRWHAYVPRRYDELELAAVPLFPLSDVEAQIRGGVEEQIRGDAPPLTGDRAKLMCGNCAVREQCIVKGIEQGYNMYLQENI